MFVLTLSLCVVLSAARGLSARMNLLHGNTPERGLKILLFLCRIIYPEAQVNLAIHISQAVASLITGQVPAMTEMEFQHLTVIASSTIILAPLLLPREHWLLVVTYSNVEAFASLAILMRNFSLFDISINMVLSFTLMFLLSVYSMFFE
ncbi:uncharacterized protein LOC132198990 [Neocloeon triangulifer]|uniref:uncharacterized protein LOC132198990 n=1 Tax=Neocloeon triangulifer TaxID=2078957 RepID=UPI00286EC454|nr:uncharacterized protein LOC132198990 [Neocloeon triangulifer]